MRGIVGTPGSLGLRIAQAAGHAGALIIDLGGIDGRLLPGDDTGPFLP